LITAGHTCYDYPDGTDNHSSSRDATPHVSPPGQHFVGPSSNHVVGASGRT
jgi:hypothetical protein